MKEKLKYNYSLELILQISFCLVFILDTSAQVGLDLDGCFRSSGLANGVANSPLLISDGLTVSSNDGTICTKINFTGNTNQALLGNGTFGTIGADDNDWEIDGNNMYANSTGNIGIGLSDPTEKLEISGGGIKVGRGQTPICLNETFLYHGENPTGIPQSDGFRFRFDYCYFGKNRDALIFEKTDLNTDTPDGGIVFLNTGQDGVEELSMFISGNGNIGVGTITPTETLDINGNSRIRNVASGTFANDLAITSNGTLTISSSDRRLKKNISNLEGVLDKVLSLQGVTYNWIDSDSSVKKDFGLIAQDVEFIFPELVFINRIDGYKGINYSRFSAIFIETFKEQQIIIDSQSKKIEELEEKINNLVELIHDKIE